jgi:thiol-disulfide isomerase/thioredoxin
VLIVAVVAALGIGGWRSMTNGVFRGTRRVGAAPGSGGPVTGVERPRPPSDVERPPQPAGETPRGDRATAARSALAGTPYDAERGERATLVQFSSAFCAPCRATRRTLADVARVVPGVRHVEVDAEANLDLVRALGVLRTPTTLVLDGEGHELTRATGAPRAAQVYAALEGCVP